MTCPYCKHDFTLTWERYVKATWGRHVCPDCQKQSRMRWSLPYFVTLLAVFLGLGWFFQFYIPGLTGVFAMVFAGLLIGTPIDKFFDSRYRKLDKIDLDLPSHLHVIDTPRDSRVREVAILAFIAFAIFMVIVLLRLLREYAPR